MTGAPIMLHSYAPDQIGRQQIAILKEEGINLSRVKIDHLPDTTDIEYLTWVAEQGCYLGMGNITRNSRTPSNPCKSRRSC